MAAENLPIQAFGPRRHVTRRLSRHGAPVIFAAAFLAFLAVLAAAAPVIAPHDPRGADLSTIYAGPSPQHWLGTDELGRDIASRLIFATRVSLLGPLLVVLLSASAGVAIALATAWRGGRFDSLVTGGLDVMLGFPALLLALIAVAVFGVGLEAPVLALGIAYTPYFARLIRSVSIRERAQTYVSALTIAGYGGWRITVRHVLPNIMPFVLTQAAVMFAYAIVDLAAISYLGVGVQPPTPDWGSMVAVGQNGVLQKAPEESLAAGVMIVLTVIALNIVGETIADRTARGRG